MMAFKLVMKEFPAWLLLSLVSLALCLFEATFLLIPSFLWAWFATATGVVLLAKADNNGNWNEFFANLSDGLISYGTEVYRLMVIIVVIVLIVATSKDIFEVKMHEFSWDWLIGHHAVTPFGFAGLLVMGGFVSFPLRYMLGIPNSMMVILNRKAARANKDNMLRHLGTLGSAVVGFSMCLFQVPATAFLWPLVVALGYVACREIFVQPTLLEEKETIANAHMVPDAG